MNRPIMDTDNFVAYIQLSDGSAMAGYILGPTVDDVENIVRKLYSDIEWQFRPELEMIYHGEGETFKKKAAEMKNAVETRKLQNSLLYGIPLDSSSKIASKITATIEQIE